MEKFIELVRQGKIEGIEPYADYNVIKLPYHYLITLENLEVGTPEFEQSDADHLCAHIRRWLSGKGWLWKLTPSHLALLPNFGPNVFTEGSELDWHLQAAIWVCEREG